MGSLTRRALLAGVLAATTVGAARGRSAPRRLAAPTIVQGTFSSSAMNGAQVGWAVSYPAGTTEESNLPVVLALHGGFGTHLQVFEGMGFQRAQSAPGLVTDVAVASVDAGTSYYHRRSDGTDTGAMILQDLLPTLTDRGLDVARLGLSGCSMGGYGAVLLAATVLQGRVAAVAPVSAALWPSLSAAPAFAFDGPDDFAEHDVFGMRDALGAVPLSVVCGLSDPFLGYNQDFVSGFRRSTTSPVTSFTPGGHDNTYWVTAAATQLTFLSRYLVDGAGSGADL
ncbi:MAG: alpha/beta hydrolase-fold protein [Lapillicoccus sp.]